VPRLLRAEGIQLTTLAEHYGMPQDEAVEDVMWLADNARMGWVVFTNDERIRHRPAEREAVRANKARCFYVTRQTLPSATMATWLIDNLAAIASASGERGPFICAVYAGEIKKMTLILRRCIVLGERIVLPPSDVARFVRRLGGTEEPARAPLVGPDGSQIDIPRPPWATPDTRPDGR
jgi:hypothetical protein